MLEAADVQFSSQFARFSPAELERMTGMPPGLQRLWRRRELLPLGEGKPVRFNTDEAAEVLVRYALSRQGVGPGDSAVLAKNVVPSVVWWALVGADGACEVVGEQAAVERFLARFESDNGLSQEIACSTDAWRLIWRADGGDFKFARGADGIGAGEEHLSILYLDLSAAGVFMANRAGRPLVTVELPVPSPAASKRVRRLTRRLLQAENGLKRC